MSSGVFYFDQSTYMVDIKYVGSNNLLFQWLLYCLFIYEFFSVMNVLFICLSLHWIIISSLVDVLLKIICR